MDYLKLVLDRRRKKRIKGIDGKTYVPSLGSTKFEVTYDNRRMFSHLSLQARINDEKFKSYAEQVFLFSKAAKNKTPS